MRNRGGGGQDRRALESQRCICGAFTGGSSQHWARLCAILSYNSLAAFTLLSEVNMRMDFARTLACHAPPLIFLPLVCVSTHLCARAGTPSARFTSALEYPPVDEQVLLATSCHSV